ncbi:hypothetical protein [Sulfidibacter corallicola]|uniref:Uncharacterized protein n=1 Tax=Sulfidibacter corallicola TaxID=2818388 RepID=A0A8A4TEV4_SULCO|nr:hypothetical protein [Sulfidibacter corallicola]QTD48486.1 hypothetical protein J3U87_23145 [Sulfidibacter corallicola]
MSAHPTNPTLFSTDLSGSFLPWNPFKALISFFGALDFPKIYNTNQGFLAIT